MEVAQTAPEAAHAEGLEDILLGFNPRSSRARPQDDARRRGDKPPPNSLKLYAAAWAVDRELGDFYIESFGKGHVECLAGMLGGLEARGADR